MELHICTLNVALNSSQSCITLQNQTNYFILHGTTEKFACIQLLLLQFENIVTEVVDAYISSIALVTEDCLACTFISFTLRGLWTTKDDSG